MVNNLIHGWLTQSPLIDYIDGSKFLRFIILLFLFFCWNLFLWIKYHAQSPQKLNPAKYRLYTVVQTLT